ncbi:MAG: NADPH:quinone oxidoreductase [Bacillus thermozeamaize]|uniref:NADPH:quinone oxidoreductase n=1 Tax=Bacillus thermozeamaize TaxID=230954 RepID=A0A1Y3PBS2_9BACI|nr:MAG: NADPH:quinone oxidoreductase [Bacillus thermozeamaize]
MKAVLVKEPGGPEQLMIGEFPRPKPREREILIRVKATAVNRADISQRQGKYPPPPGASPIMGLEVAGIVEAVGSACTRWKPGDKVFGLLPGGGYAEYAVMHEELAMPVLPGMTFEEAAAIAEVFLTAYQCLFWLGGLDKGQQVLIHAGASGVGTAAIQLVREAGGRSIVTAGSAEKLVACQKMGADVTINYKEGPFAEKVLAATGGRGADIILDFVGASYWKDNLAAIATEGRWIIISTLGGHEVPVLDLRRLMAKRITLVGTTLRSRSEDYKIRLTQAFASFALPLFEQGRLAPVIDSVFPWEEVAAAHRYMEENRNIGKIILKVG